MSFKHAYLYGIKVTDIQYNHKMLAIYTRNLKDQPRGDRITILFINVLALSGSILYLLDVCHILATNVISLLIMYLLNYLWTFLLIRKSAGLTPQDIQATDDIGIKTEQLVLERINSHQKGKIVLGYLGILFQYVSCMYFIIRYLVDNDDSIDIKWMLSIIMCVIFDLGVVENARIFLQLSLIYYLSELDIPIFSLQPLWKVVIPGKLLNLYA